MYVYLDWLLVGGRVKMSSASWSKVVENDLKAQVGVASPGIYTPSGLKGNNLERSMEGG